MKILVLFVNRAAVSTGNTSIRRRIGLAVLAVSMVAGLGSSGVLLGRSAPGAPQAPAAPAPVPASTPYVDGHTHFDERDPQKTVAAVLRAVGRENAAKIYLQIPPFGADDPMPYDAEVILPATKDHRDKVGVLGGGGSLNPMIMRAVATGDAGPDVRKRFADRAEALLRDGIAGFGEMSAEHFVGATAYSYAPADHPLYQLLADIAARAGVPIDIHMEAVPQPMALPLPLKSPPNAAELHANITAFERLLAHNTRAKIIWAHLGSDNTGFRTPENGRQLLKAHPNLYMEIKSDPRAPGRNPVLVDGRITPEWLRLFEEFPDRFVIGSDQHYPEEGEPLRWQSVVDILNQLPPGVREKVSRTNAEQVFGKPGARTGGAVAGGVGR